MLEDILCWNWSDSGVSVARIDLNWLSSETGNNTKRTGGFVSFAIALQEFRVLIYPTVYKRKLKIVTKHIFWSVT